MSKEKRKEKEVQETQVKAGWGDVVLFGVLLAGFSPCMVLGDKV